MVQNASKDLKSNGKAQRTAETSGSDPLQNAAKQVTLSPLPEQVSATIAINADHYDKLPYVSNPFPFSQPSRIGAIARLFGLNSAEPASARILEIGCASGGNIIPLAARYPQARITGIDISSVQVEAGRARIAAQGLDNITIDCASITDFEAEPASFDYIICHGVFSWVTAPVREAILAKIGQLLSAQGVADVSYNVLPGWRMRQALRDAMVLHAGVESNPQHRVTRARWIMQFLKENTSSATLWGQMFQREADLISGLADDYIAHEFLESTNEPMTFTAFAEQAASHGLAYLGDADITQMIPENLAPATAASLREMCGGQVIAVEQYMDIVTGRTFRQSLLVRQAQAVRVSRLLDPARLDALHLVANRGLMRQARADGIAQFSDPAGRTITTNQACVAQALDLLVSKLPCSVQVHDLLQQCANLQEQDFVKGALMNMVQSGMIALSSEALQCVSTVSDLPFVAGFTRTDARLGSRVVNSVHETIHLGLIGQILVPHLDGTNDSDALVRVILQAIADGKMALMRDGVALTSSDLTSSDLTSGDDLAREAGMHVRATLLELARAGLLVA